MTQTVWLAFDKYIISKMKDFMVVTFVNQFGGFSGISGEFVVFDEDELH